MNHLRTALTAIFVLLIFDVFASGELIIYRSFKGKAAVDLNINGTNVGGVSKESFLKLELQPGKYIVTTGGEFYSNIYAGRLNWVPSLYEFEIADGNTTYLSITINSTIVQNQEFKKSGIRYPINIEEKSTYEGQTAINALSPSMLQIIPTSQALSMIEPIKLFAKKEVVTEEPPAEASVASSVVQEEIEVPQKAAPAVVAVVPTANPMESWQTVGFAGVVFSIPAGWVDISDPNLPTAKSVSDPTTGSYASLTTLDASYLNIQDYHNTMVGIYANPPFQLTEQQLDIASGKSFMSYSMNSNGSVVLVKQVNYITNNMLYSMTVSGTAANISPEILEQIRNSMQLGTGGAVLPGLAGNSYSSYTNERETAKTYYNQLYSFTGGSSVSSQDEAELEKNDEVLANLEKEDLKLKKLKNQFPNLKYRRSSVYTLMLNDPTREHNNVIINTFGNAEIPEKFNNHNVGNYLIPISGTMPDAEPIISQYLRDNQIAKKLVAKWFNRTEEGAFDMNLIAERGQYDASALDVGIADGSARGRTMLSDAGEELIKNTFVIVNDYKFTNKEELAAKGKKIMNIANFAGSMVGIDLDNVTAIANTAMTVAGKGYIIKSDTYLYRLEWNEGVASQFYSQFWQSGENIDADKAAQFAASGLFSLRYVGKQSAWSDVQSTIFTNKAESELIEMATIKATDKTISKLQKIYPEFQTKTPLYSTDPILTAKIGLKEGLEPRDKFEVLEQIITPEGVTTYKRKAIITVERNGIWDNRHMAAEEAQMQGITNRMDKTFFKGNSAGLYPGMLIRQIN